MKEKDFRDDLPLITACEHCGAVLTGIAWNVGQYAPGQWFGIGIVKCEPCSWVRVAAAGSTEIAHAYARSVRLKFIGSLNS